MADLPVLSKVQLAALVAAYPPRCMSLMEEQRQHDRYAGKVELIAILAQVADEATEQSREVSGQTLENLIADGERIT